MAESTDTVKSSAPNYSEEILKQVEFYFSDSNLPQDQFLWNLTEKNEGHWVDIDVIHSFKRMRRFQSREAVVEALRLSRDLLEVNEEGTQVRRRRPLQEPDAASKRDRWNRTVYAKGFGEEAETSQIDIEKFFGQFGHTNQVRLRRNDDGTFKGSVFAEFESLDDAKKFVDTKPKFRESDADPLLVMSKHAYVEMKNQQHDFKSTANGKRKKKFDGFKARKRRTAGNNGERTKGPPTKRARLDDDVKDDTQKDETASTTTELVETTQTTELA